MNLITRVPKGVFSVSPETKALRILTLCGKTSETFTALSNQNCCFS
jgi:hypothetical protein